MSMISLQARNWHLRSLCPQCHLSIPSLSLPLLRLWPAPQVGLNNLFFHLLGRQSKTSLDSPSCVSSTMQPSRDSTTPVASILNKHPIKACRLFPRIQLGQVSCHHEISSILRRVFQSKKSQKGALLDHLQTAGQTNSDLGVC